MNAFVGDIQTGFAFPSSSVMAPDGRGGLWMLCARTGSGSNAWELYHVNEIREERVDLQFPPDSKLYSDYRGGLWVHSCKSPGPGHQKCWGLWHVIDASHASDLGAIFKYKYPAHCQIVSDGTGGLWILCDGDDSEPGYDPNVYELWHVRQYGEVKYYRFPKDSKMTSDWVGGVWILSKTGAPAGRLTLTHANRYRERTFTSNTYPLSAVFIQDDTRAFDEYDKEE